MCMLFERRRRQALLGLRPKKQQQKREEKEKEITPTTNTQLMFDFFTLMRARSLKIYAHADVCPVLFRHKTEHATTICSSTVYAVCVYICVC